MGWKCHKVLERPVGGIRASTLGNAKRAIRRGWCVLRAHRRYQRCRRANGVADQVLSRTRLGHVWREARQIGDSFKEDQRYKRIRVHAHGHPQSISPMIPTARQYCISDVCYITKSDISHLYAPC